MSGAGQAASGMHATQAADSGRIAARFRALQEAGRGGLVTYLMAGDPDRETWAHVLDGLPAGDKGRIALAVSPQNPDVVYALVCAGDESGFFRSADCGETWTRQSNHKVVDLKAKA